MSIDTACECGKEFRVKDEMAGKVVRCPACKNSVTVPGEAGPEAAPETPTTPRTQSPAVLAGVALAALVVGWTVGHFHWLVGPASVAGPSADAKNPQAAAPKLDPQSKGSISAMPNPVVLGGEPRGTTTITWDTGDGTLGQVFSSWNGNPEGLFADKASKGSKEAPWIDRDGVYEFRLYAGKYKDRLLATVTVKTN